LTGMNQSQFSMRDYNIFLKKLLIIYCYNYITILTRVTDFYAIKGVCFGL